MEPISVMMTQNGLPMNYFLQSLQKSIPERIHSVIIVAAMVWHLRRCSVLFLPQINITFGDASELYLDVFFRVVLLDLVFLALTLDFAS